MQPASVSLLSTGELGHVDRHNDLTHINSMLQHVSQKDCLHDYTMGSSDTVHIIIIMNA